MYKLVKTGSIYNLPLEMYFCDNETDFNTIKNEVPIYTKVIIWQDSNNKTVAKIKLDSGWIQDRTGGASFGINYQIESTLPQTGEEGIIYLIPKTAETNNIYDEYMWINNTFEKIGTTEVDLSGYIPIVSNATGEVPKIKSNGKLESSGIAATNVALKSDFPIVTQEEYDELETKTAFLYLIREE